MKLCILLMAFLLCVHSTWSQSEEGASSTPHGPSTTTKPDSTTTSPKTSPESTKTTATTEKTTATTEKTTATTEKTTTTTEKTTGATKAPTLGETKTKATEETVKNPGSVPNVTFHPTTAAPTNKSANVPTSVATTNSSTSGTDAHLSGTTTGSQGGKTTKKGGKHSKKSGKAYIKYILTKHITDYSNSSLMDFLQQLEKEAILRGLRVGHPKAPTQKVAPIHTESPKTTATTEKTTATTEKTTGATKAPGIGETKTKATEETVKNPGPKPANRTPDSSHFAVVFLVMIAILFGLYALYHNRQKIIAVVVEGRSANGHGGRDRYRKLDNESLEPEARIKNSNEVYVY